MHFNKINSYIVNYIYFIFHTSANLISGFILLFYLIFILFSKKIFYIFINIFSLIQITYTTIKKESCALSFLFLYSFVKIKINSCLLPFNSGSFRFRLFVYDIFVLSHFAPGHYHYRSSITLDIYHFELFIAFVYLSFLFIYRFGVFFDWESV